MNNEPLSPPLALTLDDAAALAGYARRAAQAAGVAAVFSLMTPHGQQRYFFSMDNALLISYSLAGEKAWTAVALRMPTADLATLTQPGCSLYGLQSDHGVCCVGGGLPCWSRGQLLGGIGISGGTAEQDIAIAQAALALFSQSHFPLTPYQ